MLLPSNSHKSDLKVNAFISSTFIHLIGMHYRPTRLVLSNEQTGNSFWLQRLSFIVAFAPSIRYRFSNISNSMLQQTVHKPMPSVSMEIKRTLKCSGALEWHSLASAFLSIPLFHFREYHPGSSSDFLPILLQTSS